MRGILTLCGSTKFKYLFEDANRILTCKGWIVLSVGSYHHTENNPDIKQYILDHKEKLDKLHKEKIAMSQGIVILTNEDFYLGDSTISEIKHANKLGKQVYLWNSRIDRAYLECSEES